MNTKTIRPTAVIYKLGSQLTFVLANRTYSINKNDPFFLQAVAAYAKGDWDTVLSFVDRPQYLVKYSEGRVKVVDGAVLYDDQPIHGYVVDKILAFMEAALPIGPIVRFLDDLQNAKAEHVKEDLYKFLELNDLPLTDDGGFLAYKQVKADGSPFFIAGTNIVYKVGETYEMEYKDCDTSRDECGRQGWHCGNRSFWGAGNFDAKGDYTGNGRMLMVKLMPSWVVSVPSSASGSKLRAFKMEVVAEYNKAARKQEDHVKSDFKLTSESETSVRRPPQRDAYGRFGNNASKPSFKRAVNGRFIPKGVATICPTFNKQPKRDLAGRFISVLKRAEQSFDELRDAHGRKLYPKRLSNGRFA